DPFGEDLSEPGEYGDSREAFAVFFQRGRKRRTEKSVWTQEGDSVGDPFSAQPGTEYGIYTRTGAERRTSEYEHGDSLPAPRGHGQPHEGEPSSDNTGSQRSGSEGVSAPDKLCL